MSRKLAHICRTVSRLLGKLNNPENLFACPAGIILRAALPLNDRVNIARGTFMAASFRLIVNESKVLTNITFCCIANPTRT